MKKVAKLAGIVLIILVVLAGVAIAGGFLLTSPVAEGGQQFMESLARGNYSNAYALGTASLQQELGNADQLQFAIERNGLFIRSWQVQERNRDSNQGKISGLVEFTDGRSGVFTLYFEQVAGEWRVSGFSIQPDP